MTIFRNLAAVILLLGVACAQIQNPPSKVTDLLPTNGSADQVLLTTSPLTAVWTSFVNCGDATHAIAYSTSTHTFSCQAITASGTPGGSTTQVQYNNASAFAGSANWTFNPVVGFALTQGANAVDAIVVTRNTDTSPTGNFMNFKSAAAASLASIDITGLVKGNGLQSTAAGAGVLTLNASSSGTTGWTGPTGAATTYSWKMPLADAQGPLVSDGAANISVQQMTTGQAYILGGFTTYQGTTDTALAVTQNEVRCLRQNIPFPWTITKITILIGTTDAAGHASVGLYDGAGTTRLVYSGIISTAVTAAVTTTITAVSGNPGWYNFCATSDSATATFRVLTPGGNMDFFLNGGAGATFNYYYTGAVSSGGALNTTIGTKTNVSSGSIMAASFF